MCSVRTPLVSASTWVPTEPIPSPRHSPASRHAFGEILFVWQANIARNPPPPSTPSSIRCFEALLHQSIRPGGRRCARLPSSSPFPLHARTPRCCMRWPRSSMCAPRQAPGTRHTPCMHSLEHACRVRRSVEVACGGGELTRVGGGCVEAEEGGRGWEAGGGASRGPKGGR